MKKIKKNQKNEIYDKLKNKYVLKKYTYLL